MEATKRLYRSHDVLAVFGWHKATLHRKMAEGTFPRPSKLSGGRLNYWPASVIEDYLAAQLKPDAEAA